MGGEKGFMFGDLLCGPCAMGGEYGVVCGDLPALAASSL